MAKRRLYTDEFKREAVKLVTDQGYTQAEAARSLGIHANLLRNWRKKFTLEVEGTQTMSETEQQELKRLREEVRRLRMERDILKKATAFFASENR
jgi:transposase